MNKQRLILISIFVITFVIGLGAIILSNLITTPRKSANNTTPTTVSIPSLSSYTLSCTSTASNKSLTIQWTAPSTLPSTDAVKGQIFDLNSQTQPIAFGPIPVSQDSYTFTQANGLDTYYATLWIEDSHGNKGTTVSTGQVNSSLCTSGSQPTVTALATTASPTATTTSTPTQAATTTPTTTASSTPTPSTSESALSCNEFSLSQDGNQLTSTSVAAGSSALTITSGITAANGATVTYTNATWSIAPSGTQLSTSSDNSSATWNPPSNAGGSTYTISLSGVTDSNGDALSSPCTLAISVTGGSSSLPDTADELPTIAILVAGLILTLVGAGLFLKD